MSENYDHLIGTALDEFRAAEESAAGPAHGAAAVRATVTRRRKIRLTTFGVLGALLIALPIGAFAANPRGNSSPPSADEVASVLRCPVRQAAHADLDSDPALETAVIAECRPGQVPAFDRDRWGRAVPLGVIVAEPAEGIKARPAGGITVTVGYRTANPSPADPPAQERGFTWDGARFVQVDGPSAFVRVITDLAITGGPLRLGDGSGTLTLTVTNNGGDDVDFFRLSVSTGHRITIWGMRPVYGALKAGASVSVSLTVTVDTGPDQVPLLLSAGVYSFIDDPYAANNSVEIEVTR